MINSHDPASGFPRAVEVRAVPRGRGLLLGLALCPGLSLAHYPWMTPADYAPREGEPLAFSIGWGHAFPGTDTLAHDRLAAAELLDATGQVHPVALGPGTEFATPPLPGAGPWILAARVAPGYYSRTPQGGQRASRVEYPGALSCGYSNNTVKTLLSTGDGAVDQPLGHPLEIVPLDANPGTAAPFPVRVLYQGTPWRGEVNAVHVGFEGAEDEYPLTVATDAEGVARLAFGRAGRWMLKASASEAYPDPAVCDRSNYNATLTLMVH